MMNRLAQIAAITAMNLRSLPERKTSSIVAIIGIAGVVAILVGVLSMREGFQAALVQSGAEDVAIILRSGANDELSSSLQLDQTHVIADAPGIKRGSDNLLLVSPELYGVVDVPMRGTGNVANVPFRGVYTLAPKLRQHFKVIEGRMFTPGHFEVIVGRGAAMEFAGLEVGRKVHWGNADWNVVGIFEDDGSVSESEVWTDVTVLRGAYRRDSSFQSVRVQLIGPLALQRFKDALTADPRLSVHVFTEREYYAEQSRSISALISSAGYSVAILMGIGAVFAALNTMYSAVAARTREIATLRALGFGAGPVVMSVLTEALVLGVIGAVLGAVGAYLGFNGIRTSTLNWDSFAQVTFAFEVTSGLLLQGFAYALLLAFLGGLLPGIHAARLSVKDGLRE